MMSNWIVRSDTWRNLVGEQNGGTDSLSLCESDLNGGVLSDHVGGLLTRFVIIIIILI